MTLDSDRIPKRKSNLLRGHTLAAALTSGCLTAALIHAAGAAPGPTTASPDVTRAQTLLKSRCGACHSDAKPSGGLSLSSPEALRRGGDAGAAVTPGSPESGALWKRITAADSAHRMPKGGPPLTPQERGWVRAWLTAGAPLAAAGASAESHWSFRRIESPPLPPGSAGRNPIDAFVRARLKRLGVAPSPEADRRTLLRRISLDLTGLPPTLEEMQAFLADPRPDAYEQQVDRLLASTHFGERWGRQWLDLVRYADSDGYENDQPRPYAWRYRDWVIRAINADLPFDRFTVAQLAGDLLPNPTPEDRIAGGMHRNALHNSAGGADKEEFRTRAVKDRVNPTGTVWLGLTVACAQCHSHKYDPLTHREYYSLYAFFNSLEHDDLEIPGGKAAGLKELPTPRVTRVHLRGDFLSPGPDAPPATPAFLPPLRARGPRADRLDLARWLVDRENPLTARVFANQVWQTLFGEPLVPSPENFGRNGSRPTQPELLDALASALLRRPGEAGGPALAWSRKGLIRLIVLSETYRQSSLPRTDLEERDPRNTLLARQNRVRVDAEIVRDLALHAAGLLDPAVGGPSFQPALPRSLARLPELKNERFMEATSGPQRFRRSVYINSQRTFPHPALAAFDSADNSQACTRRDRSTTPIQALTLLNDPNFAEAAAAVGVRLAARDIAAGSETDALRFAFERCLGRRPDAAEERILLELLRKHREHYRADLSAARKWLSGTPLPSGVSPENAAAWGGVARAILNLEEFITRE